MRTFRLILVFQIVILAIKLTVISCKAPVENSEAFQFPKIDWIDPAVYKEIIKTCCSYWDLNNMIDDTFEIKIEKGIGYIIACDGYSEGTICRFYILVDKNGQWQNGGSTPKNP